MIRITRRLDTDTKRYSVATVAHALGITEGAIQGHYTSQNISLKDGLTMDMIEAVINGPRRKTSIDWKGVEEIRESLRMRGYVIEEAPFEEEERLPL